MKRYIDVAGLVVALALAFACGSSASDSPAGSGCNGGTALEAEGHALCVFTAEIIETGFRCPELYPHRYDLSQSEAVACAQEANLQVGALDLAVHNALRGSNLGGAGGAGGEGGAGGAGGGAGGSCTVQTALALEPAAIDVLLVIDDSGSMADEQAALASGIDQLLSPLQNFSFQIGATTTDTDVPFGARGRLVPVDGSRPRIVGPTTPDPIATLQANVIVGVMGSTVEKGIGAAILAVTPPLSDSADHPSTTEPDDGNLGFVRSGAHLAVLVLSDEDDQTGGNVADLAAQLLAAKGSDPDLVSFHTFFAEGGCPTPITNRYTELAAHLNGETIFACTNANFAQDVATFGQAFAQRTVQRRWSGATPTDRNGDGAVTGADLTVRVDGVVVPEIDGNGERHWFFDEREMVLVFDGAHAPLPGATVEIEQDCAPSGAR